VTENLAATFRRLHDGPAPLRLVNAWDALSARVFAVAGAPAIGTSSFAVAYARGYQDGQHIPWEQVCETVAEMTAAVDVPVSADIEAGQGAAPDKVASAVADVLQAGAVGVNIEDSRPDAPGQLFDVAEQAERLAAARAASDDLYINARCDVFFGAAIPDEEKVDAALARAAAYVVAGADGIFLPGLLDLDTIGRVTSAMDAPLNVMLWPGLPPVEELEKAGVRRISQGAGSFLLAVAQLERLTKAYLDGPPDQLGGDLTPAFHLLPNLSYR
jgi:2-methylisocitrate lyase-like PEP mutase family enzyme